MPLPNPRPNESEDNFMQRCMSDETMREEYPTGTQRYAVCVTQWSKKGDKDE